MVMSHTFLTTVGVAGMLAVFGGRLLISLFIPPRAR
jgi:hypothetical protein